MMPQQPVRHQTPQMPSRPMKPQRPLMPQQPMKPQRPQMPQAPHAPQSPQGSKGMFTNAVRSVANAMTGGALNRQIAEEQRSCLLYTSDAADE